MGFYVPNMIGRHFHGGDIDIAAADDRNALTFASV